MAIVGQQLLVPEDGYRRIQESDPLITCNGPWLVYSYTGGSSKYSSQTGELIKFNFTRDKIRLIGTTNTTHSGSISVIIDGITVATINQTSVQKDQVLDCDITGLFDGEHTLKIINNTSSYYSFDAIDINASGEIKPYNPWVNKTKNSTSQMKLGDRIAIEYTALANTFGTFANIGKATKPEIPIASTVTPDGTFYFYHVGYDFLGRMKLVADRNIQYSISYDTLNTAGVASGSGLPIKIDSKDYTVRLLTGGTSTNDKDNEWDKIIVDSTLGGTITAGDNSVWNWISIYSYVSNLATPSNQPTIRGYGTVETLIPLGATTSFSSYQVGFRPMLLVEADPTINISKVTPTHLYGNQHSGCTVEAVAPISNATIIYKTIINGAEDTFMSGEHHIDISKFRVGNNTVRVETTEGDSASVDVILEEPHRTSANRTFTSIDGGYLITNS